MSCDVIMDYRAEDPCGRCRGCRRDAEDAEADSLRERIEQLTAERDAACSLLRESREELHDGEGEPIAWARKTIARIDRFLAALKEPKP